MTAAIVTHPGKEVTDHPAVDGRRQGIAFRRRHKGAGRNLTAILGEQTHQHLIACQPTILGILDRLHTEPEQIAVQRLTQARDPLHFAAPFEQLLVVGLKDMNPIAAGILGRIAGAVCGTQQGAKGLARFDRNQANTDPHGEALALPTEAKGLHQRAQAVNDRYRFVKRTTTEQQTEFIATQSRQHITAADTALEQLRQLAQQLIPRRMPTGVVDHLELVEVHIAEHLITALSEGQAEHRRQPTLELGAVGQSGQGVMGRLMRQLTRQPPGIGNIMEAQYCTHDPPLGITDRCYRVLNCHITAIAAAQQQAAAVLPGNHLAIAPQQGRDRVAQGLAG